LNPIPAGNPINLTVLFKDVNNSPTDPSSGIAIQVKAPDGTLSTFTYPSTVSKIATGTYVASMEVSDVGRYWAVGYGTLANGFQVTSDDAFQDVSASRVV